MEKKVMDALHVMLCGEIEEISKKGSLSHETLDILKDLVETEKNLGKIEKYETEKEEMKMGMGMDGGYSQRKFYIDADYQPPFGNSYGMNNSYAQGGNGNSYGRGGQTVYGMDMYGRGNSYMDGGNSYNYYDPRYEMPYAMRGGNGGGYARTGSKDEMVRELNQMMTETKDETVKKAIAETIAKVG